MARFRKSSAAAAEAAGGARSHDVHIDQYLAGGEMSFEVITIDRFIHPKAALAAFDACEPLRHETLTHSFTLAVQPNEQLSGIVKRLSFLAPIFRWWLGTNKEAPMIRFPEIANPQTGPIPETVTRMREHDQAAPFYMMNLNKYYAQARYPERTKDDDRQTSGEKAYVRYSNRILPYLVSVGGYPDVFGKVVWMLAGVILKRQF